MEVPWVRRGDAAMPLIESANRGAYTGIGCPDGEMHPADPINGAWVRAHFIINMIVFALAKQVQIKIAKNGWCISSWCVIMLTIWLLWNFLYGHDRSILVGI